MSLIIYVRMVMWTEKKGHKGTPKVKKPFRFPFLLYFSLFFLSISFRMLIMTKQHRSSEATMTQIFGIPVF